MIPDTWLEDLKRKVDLVELGRRYGVQWDTRGREPRACCPFHEESAPSFHVLREPRRGAPRFVCYGGCGRSWSAVSFLVDGHHRDYLDAIRELADLAGLTVPPRTETEAAARQREAAKARREAVYAAQVTAQEFFTSSLQADNPEALAAREYLRSRGLAAAAEPWGLGYAPLRGLWSWLRDRGVPEDVAEAAYLLRRADDGRPYAFLRKRITLPWRDRQGRILCHVGRAVLPEYLPKYVNAGEIPGVYVKGEAVFGIHEAQEAIHRSREAWVVEGQISAVTPHLHGIQNVVACGGKAFTAAHARTLRACGAERLVLVMDGDDAGRSGAAAAVRVCLAEGLPVRVLALPEGLDPDDWFRIDGERFGAAVGRMTDRAQLLRQRAAEAEDGLLWLARRLVADAGGPLERQRVLAELAPLVAGLGPVAADGYAAPLAKVLGVSAKVVRAALAAAQQEPERPPRETPEGGPGTNGHAYPAETLRQLQELSDRHCVVQVGGATWVGKRVRDPITGEDDLEFGTFGDFTRFWGNRECFVPDHRTGGVKRQELPKAWLSAPPHLRPEYEGLVFLPGRDAGPRHLNLWRGLAVEPQRGDCSRYWAHVEEVVTVGNPELYQYVRKWMAHAVQKPWEVPGVAVVLRGLQGVGKGVFVNYFGELFGRHYLPVSSMDLVSGRFNSHLKDVLVLFADEALWGGDRSREGLLKQLITEKWVVVEGKGKDAIRVQNFKRLLIATNNAWPVPRDKDDRRTVVIDVDVRHKEDRAYFGALHDQMRRGGLQALLWDLQHESLEGFDPGQRPSLDHGFDMKLRSASSCLQWWHQCLADGENARKDDEQGAIEYWDTHPPVEALHAAYLRWGERLKLKYLEGREQWARELRTVLPRLSVIRPRTGGNKRRYVVGHLEDCRADFQQAFRVGPEVWKAHDGDETPEEKF